MKEAEQNQATPTLRESVRRFAEAMELKLRQHDKDRGERGWYQDSAGALLDRALEELGEADRELRMRGYSIRNGRTEDAERHNDLAVLEFVDAANFCMMAFDVMHKGKESQ